MIQITIYPLKTNSLDNERVEDGSSKPPIRKDLVNWIRLVTLDQIGKRRDSVLFKQADFSPQKSILFTIKSLL